MGAAERLSRRSVLRAAEQSVDKVNESLTRYNEVVSAVQKADADRVAGDRLLDERINAQAKWIARLEGNITALKRELGATAGQNDLHRVEHIATSADAVRCRGFWGRLKWLVTGQ
jgi:hypothetical protein